ncbi:MAG: carbohydrate ABC transporter permease [Eubacteriales bacterium]|nr:carbohydrate ABC transporter permease [Eubacteriales bacterium]MDY4008944.1 carbohydrate ABC transporter permease [Candidatus Limiplasma sp.]
MKRNLFHALSRDRAAFSVLGYLLLTVLALFCLFPFVLILSGSFTSQDAILRNGYRLVPSAFSTEAYKFLFRAPDDLLRAYGVSIAVTAAGTLISLFITSMAAYALSSYDFPYRNGVSFFFYFTTVFGGGLVPWFIFNIKYLQFKNSLHALVLPTVLNVTYLLILKSYMRNIPEAVYESARLDGANDWEIYTKIVMPLSKAGLATVGLFVALNYWNDWYNAMLYIDDSRLYPLQYYLNDILNKSQGMAAAAARAGIPAIQVPSEPVKLAMTVVATGPLILLYPMLQKYFVKGVTIGAVKG